MQFAARGFLAITVLLTALALTGCRRATEPEPKAEPSAAEAPAPTAEVEPAARGEVAANPAPSARPSAPARSPSRPASAPAPPPKAESTATSEPVATPEKSEADLPRPAAPAPPPPPPIREVTIPEGAILELELLTAMDTAVSRVGDEIQARTLSPVRVKGEVVLPEGTLVEGRVTEVQSSGRVKGRARLAFTFDRVKTRSGHKKILSSFVEKEAEDGRKKDATVIGGAAGLGAIVGGIVGGKKGAAIGATIGGASGTGVVLATKGEEIQLPAGTEVNVRLDQPLVVVMN